MKTFRKLLSLSLAIVLLFGSMSNLVACGGNGPAIDNEETRLVLSTSELDGVFNPFYSSSAPDGSVVGMTQWLEWMKLFFMRASRIKNVLSLKVFLIHCCR